MHATAKEMTAIDGLLRYMNFMSNLKDAQVDAEVALTDSNGESLGRLRWDQHANAYVWEFPRA
jgi:hypothetical protein